MRMGSDVEEQLWSAEACAKVHTAICSLQEKEGHLLRSVRQDRMGQQAVYMQGKGDVLQLRGQEDTFGRMGRT